MTRGYAFYTQNGKTPCAVAYLSSDAYPSYGGMRFLEAIQNNTPLSDLGEHPAGENGEPLPYSAFSDMVPCKGIVQEECHIDYVYVYNLESGKLWVRYFGTLLYTFDLNTQMELCKAVFQLDDLLSTTLCINPKTLVYTYKNYEAVMRKVPEKISSREELVKRIAEGPHAYISYSGKLRTAFSRNENEFEHVYRLWFLREQNDIADWQFVKGYEVRFVPGSQHCGQHGVSKSFRLFVSTPWGQVQLSAPNSGAGVSTFSKRAGEQFLSAWVAKNEESLFAYIPVFAAVQDAQHALSELERRTDAGAKELEEAGTEVILACMRKIRPITDSVPAVKEFQIDKAEYRLRSSLQNMIENILWDRNH